MKMKMMPFLQRLHSDRFLDKLSNDRILDLAAALSYYTALSLAPLLILLITFVSFLGMDFKTEMIAEIKSLVGSQASQAITAIAMNADKTPTVRDWAGVVGVITLLFSAGAIFGQLRESLNVIFEVESPTEESKEEGLLKTSWSFIKKKIFSMGMVLAFVFISMVSLVISSIISLVLSGAAAIIGQIANFLISLLIFSLLFAAIYYFLPQKKMRSVEIMTGGLITAILFSIGKTLIGLYLGQSAVGSLYGAAGSLIVLLMWVYYSSIIIFLGAEIANEIHKVDEEQSSTLTKTRG
ncbi:YihY/virulence factor BrkB family protein [Bdellovibrio sp. ArHS]|uniref:YihY/virulence factor BrkB family protein n=1 Tax=Bdellovibrio sp. ArHS TaxID=1569284 RepID=UPI000AF8BDB6|nr:YihY/virulence factor BrkB family protein [Bdellovibrio sp. ArHS]